MELRQALGGTMGIGVEFDFYVVWHAAAPRWEVGPGLRGPMAPRP
ncbi:MAG TPA: hypothetical protein VNX66_02620 [Candidatus Sulfotelmatobacter sp.]|nr:hypothetical protein [Candidatus Sulfotelmatobacter sp.]